jgi:hypothetical protein
MIDLIPYTLEVISRHPDTNGKQLKQFSLRGELCIGALMNEPFEILFTNRDPQYRRVAVKISLDGTDLMTGELATSEYTAGKMWIVEPFGSLSLKAWPETEAGGAALVFTGLNQSVAVHTHGDISNRGIIAAAVFVETYVPPPAASIPYVPPPGASIPYTPWPIQYAPYVVPNKWYVEYPYWQLPSITTIIPTIGASYPNITWTVVGNNPSNNGDIGGVWTGSSGDLTMKVGGGSVGSTCITSSNWVETITQNVVQQSPAAIGAGQYTEQKISYSAGLTSPKLETTLKLRYDWWENLQGQLRANEPSQATTGFPGDAKRRMSLGTTPRVGASEQKSEPMQYQRV